MCINSLSVEGVSLDAYMHEHVRMYMCTLYIYMYVHISLSNHCSVLTDSLKKVYSNS